MCYMWICGLIFYLPVINQQLQKNSWSLVTLNTNLPSRSIISSESNFPLPPFRILHSVNLEPDSPVLGQESGGWGGMSLVRSLILWCAIKIIEFIYLYVQHMRTIWQRLLYGLKLLYQLNNICMQDKHTKGIVTISNNSFGSYTTNKPGLQPNDM